jgi:hypothetical protein
MLSLVVGYQYVIALVVLDRLGFGGGEGGGRQQGREECKNDFHRPFFPNLQVGGALEEADG